MTEEIWGVWATPTERNPSELAYAQWLEAGLSRQHADSLCQEQTRLWSEAPQGAMWTFEVLRCQPRTEKREMSAVEKLARALHAEEGIGTEEKPGPLRPIVLDARPKTEAEALARIAHVCGIAWSRLTDSEREVYLSRAIGLLGFIAELEK